jgi:carotenoid cleavage dioxygenase
VGELPRELNGTLYRNGPNPQFEAPGAHWFVGDGMLHAFHLENGRASYRNRWVRTPKWQAEHDTGRALFGGFGRKLPDAPASVTPDGGVANTNIIFHAGRLLALEEGHLPTEIEPGTLKRTGYCDYNGGISGPFTAHPKIDPVTGEMVFFGYNAAGPLTPALSFGSVNASGVVTRFDRFEAPYASMVHDFIVTENHMLFPILPITGSMERAMRGRPPYAWEPEKGGYVGVMKRNGPASDIVWFRAETCYVFHVMNAWEEGDRIVADVMQYEEAPLFPIPTARTDPEIQRPAVPLDLRSRRQYRPLHPNLSRRHHRRIPAHRRSPRRSQQQPWLVRLRQSRPAVRRCALRHRACRRQGLAARQLSAAGGRHHFEPVLSSAAGCREGDGWLLAAVWRARENRSDLAVFNATDVAAGPVALVQLGHRVPDGFHGNWVGAA